MSRQPIDFTARPNRNKTQKWQTARTYNYDGDDWGGYDPYDYGEYDDSAPPPMPQQPPLPSQMQRQNSFDRGDERRQFSGPANLQPYANDVRERSPAQSAVSSHSSGRPSVDSQRARPVPRPRDFTNPAEVPAPLSMRGPQMPTMGPPAATTSSFPPRKESVSSSRRSPAITPAAEVPPPASTTMLTTTNEAAPSAIPFIRPSDIYKRVEQEKEKERASMESSSRPSMDSLQREALTSSTERAHARPLSSVVEAPPTPQHANFGHGPGLLKPKDTSPVLPEVSRFSGFGSDFLGGGATAAGKQVERDLPATRAPPGADPAAEILAERQHTIPITQVGRQPDELTHQPSQGYRSMVNKAFDARKPAETSIPQTPISRDGSQSTRDFSRSNTTSSSVISPIMSRVPIGAGAQQSQEELDRSVPPIAEESAQAQSNPAVASADTGSWTPMGHNRDLSGGSAATLSALGIEAGYRRSYHAPSGDNSPAHMAGVENSQDRRLSQPLAAETIEDDGKPGGMAASQSTFSDVSSAAVGIPRTGRARAGTDYSIREADMAQEVNMSPEAPEFSPEMAAQEHANQSLFLNTYAATPTSAIPPVIEQTASLDAGTASPSKGRVREIADKYTEIHNASRSNSISSSKSSWSNFRGSDENLALRRKGTDTNPSGTVEGDDELKPEPLIPGGLNVSRPEAAREPSFRPHLPGEWVSYSGVPESDTMSAASAVKSDRDITPRASQVPWQPEVDPTPTTEKVPLEGAHAPASETTTGEDGNFFAQAKNAGEALGAALMSTVGNGHQTQDFASTGPAPEVEQPDTKLRSGEVGDSRLRPPPMQRADSEITTITDVPSSASSVPPAPPAKDTPRDMPGAAPGANSTSVGRDYFTGEVAPLRTEKHWNQAISTSTNSADDERIRREIEDSLGNFGEDGFEENRQRTQDALDAPANVARVDAGAAAIPPAEARPNLPDHRFSWEKTDDPAPASATTASVAATQAVSQPPPSVQLPERDDSPEIKPEMPYERPRSRNLHLMNADSSDEEAEAIRLPKSSDRGLAETHPTGATLGGPFAVDFSSLEQNNNDLNLHLSPTGRQGSDGRELKELMPSPVSADFNNRLPSYYMQDHSPMRGDEARETEIREAHTLPESKENAVAADGGLSSEVDSTTKSSKKVPPFREILAIKSAPDRINAYDETRQTFADMNTGLSDWLSTMLGQHPEYANLSTSVSGFQAPALKSGGTAAGMGHRQNSGSIAMRLGSQQRSGSLDATDSAPSRTPARDFVGNAVDMDKMQQRGKDLMKSAGVLGGKAQVGAKGLFAKGAKGFQRFGTKRESSGGAGSGKAPPASAGSTSSDPAGSSSQHSLSRLAQVSEPLSSAHTLDGIPDQAQRPALYPPEQALPVTIIHNAHIPSSSPSPMPPDASDPRPPPPPPPATTHPDISRTTSSTSPSTGSGLSQTLSNTLSRLRSRTRNSSRHRSSRPGSWAVDSSTANQPSVTTASNESEPSPFGASTPLPASFAAAEATRPPLSSLQTDFSATPPPTSQVSIDDRNKRTESWNLPGAQAGVRPRTPGRDSSPWRLGILPSPGTAAAERPKDYFDAVSPTDSAAAAAASAASAARNAGESDMAGKRDVEGFEGANDVPPVPAPPAELPRRGSDLAALPSQIRRKSLASSRKLVLDAMKREAEAKAETRAEAEVEAKAEAELDEQGFPRGTEHTQNTSGYKGAPIFNREIDVQPGAPVLLESTRSEKEGDTEMNLTNSKGTDGASVDTAHFDDALENLDNLEDQADSGGPPSPLKAWEIRNAAPEDGRGNNTETGESFSIAPSRRSSVSSLESPEAAIKSLGPDVLEGGKSHEATAGSHEDVQAVNARNVQVGLLSPKIPALDQEIKPPFESRTVDEETRLKPSDSAESSHSDSRAANEPPLKDFPAQPIVEDAVERYFNSNDRLVDKATESRQASIGPPSSQGAGFRNTGALSLNSRTYERMRSPLSPASPRHPSTEQESAEANEKWSRRLSLFRNARPKSMVVDQPLPDPGPSDVSKKAFEQSDQDEKQSRRRSSIWESIKRAPSTSRASVNRQSSIFIPPGEFTIPPNESQARLPENAEPSTSKANTLRKQVPPQRAVSTTGSSDPKKNKRFSGLGSLFGRSSTVGRGSEKPNRLMKSPPPQRLIGEAQHVLDDKLKRQQSSDGRDRDLSSHSSVRHRRLVSDLHDVPMPPVGAGFYERPLREPTLPVLPAQVRRRSDYGNVAHAWPGQASPTVYQATSPGNQPYGDADIPARPFTHGDATYPYQEFPVRAPPSTQIRPMSTVQPLPHSPSGESDYYWQQRHSSYSSTRHSLSPQISGRSEWQRSERAARGSESSISPVQSRMGSASWSQQGRNQRIGSIDAQVTWDTTDGPSMRQAPTNPALTPSQDGFTSDFRPSYQAQARATSLRQAGQPHETYHPQNEMGMPPSYLENGPPGDFRYDSSSMPRASVTPRSRPLPPWETDTMPQAQQQSQTYAPGTQFFQERQYEFTAPPQAFSRQYTYSNDPQHVLPPPVPTQSPRSMPPFRQRQWSGGRHSEALQTGAPQRYNGRRDEPSVNEETYDMRGASYPGQEWTPSDMS